jgi:hypothetical protein
MLVTELAINIKVLGLDNMMLFRLQDLFLLKLFEVDFLLHV